MDSLFKEYFSKEDLDFIATELKKQPDYLGVVKRVKAAFESWYEQTSGELVTELRGLYNKLSAEKKTIGDTDMIFAMKEYVFDRALKDEFCSLLFRLHQNYCYVDKKDCDEIQKITGAGPDSANRFQGKSLIENLISRKVKGLAINEFYKIKAEETGNF